MSLTESQIQEVIDWMNKWDALRESVFPEFFREDFTPKCVHEKVEVEPDQYGNSHYCSKCGVWNF